MACAWLVVCLTMMLLSTSEAASTKRCPPLTSVSVDLQCWRKTDKVTSVNCSEPAAPDTSVTFKCREYHEGSPSGEARCGPAGAWSQPLPQCKPKCGISNLNSVSVTPVIVGGQDAQVGNFPWHAGIYHLQHDRWNQVCGGSLISPRVILTAAKCVSEFCFSCLPKPMNSSDVRVSLGKNFRDWDKAEEYEIKRAVKEIHIHPRYRGTATNYHSDLAVVVLEEDVPVNGFVLPVCLDQDKKHNPELFSGGRLGYVVGWGSTEDCALGTPCVHVSNTLRQRQTAVLDYAACAALIEKLSKNGSSSLARRLPADKYCAGNGTDSVLGAGDSGEGLVFRFGDRHFIYGVSSLKLRTKDYSVGAFTALSEYLPWIYSKIV